MTIQKSANTDVLLSMLLMLHDNKLLLVPNVSVAEVITMQVPTPVAGQPAWIEGLVQWRGIQVPLGNYEMLNGLKRRPNTDQARIAIFNSYSGHADVPFFAISVQTIPKMLQLKDSDLKANTNARPWPLELAVVQTQIGQAGIIDVEKLEHQFIRLGKITP